MTREEQIKQQAMSVIGVPPELSPLEWFRMSFKEGAKQADNNPKECREKIEQLEIKYFELFKKAREEDKQKLIAEACIWLKENIDFYSYNAFNTKSGYTEITLTDVFETVFRQAMEDLK